SRLSRNQLMEQAEMRLHGIEGAEIADPLVKLRRAFEVGEEEGQAGDLQVLIGVDRVAAIDGSEGLVGQEALRGQERTALREELVQCMPGDPDGRQGALLGAIFQ